MLLSLALKIIPSISTYSCLFTGYTSEEGMWESREIDVGWVERK